MAGRRDVEAGSAYVRLWMKSTEFDRGVRTLKRNLKEIGSTMTSAGRSMVGISASIVAPLALAVKAASDVEETMNKFNVVFGENSKAVKKWGDEYSKAVGRSKQQVADFLAASQDLFVPMGFTSGDSEDLSKQITKLAVDLASFNNKADADVLRDLHAALTGSGEVMKKYGVIVSEAAVKQELLNMRLDPKIATEAEKAQARLNIILRGTTAAHGDAIRSASGFANQMKALQASVADAAAEIGGVLLPVVTPMIEDVADLAKNIGQWATENKGLVTGVAAAAAAIGASGLALIAFGKLAYGAAAAVGALTTAMTFMAAHPVAIVVAGFVAAAGAIAYFESTAQRLPSVMGEVRQKSDEMRAADQALMKELSGLSEKQKLTNEEMSRANEIIDTLEGRYGDLGLSIDGTAGKIDGMADAQAKLNEAMKRAAVGQLRAEAQALEAEIAGMEAARDTWWADVKRGASGWIGGDAGAIEAAKIQAEYARLDALRARIRAAEGGDTDALTAGATATATAPVIPVTPGPPPGYDFDNMGPGLWDQVDFEEMGREADAFFAKLQANQGVEDATRRLEIEQSITDEREKQRRLIELEREIALRDAGENGADADKINRYYDEKQAGIEADTQQANQRYVDNTKRLEIEQSSTDEKEKQRRLIEFEREIALRDTGGADADKVNAYFDTRLAGIKDVVKMQGAVTGPSGTFSTAAAMAMTGRTHGTEQQRTAKATEETNKKMGSVLETLAKMAGAPDMLIAELKKAFSFG